MYNLLIPIKKTKKSYLRGFWIDKNKIYYDYLTVKSFVTLKECYSYVKNNHDKLNQLAYFIIYQGKNTEAYLIYSKKWYIEKLKYNLIIHYNTRKIKKLKKLFKLLLYFKGGFTIDIRKKFILCFYNDKNNKKFNIELKNIKKIIEV